MDLLNLMRAIAASVALIPWTDSHSSTVSDSPTTHHITHLRTRDSLKLGFQVATCHQQEFGWPFEAFGLHTNPSPLHSLSAELNESQSSLTVRWAINVDSTIETIVGTWISYTDDDEKSKYYRCEYQPAFTSREISVAGVEQLWFSFTVSDVSICPSYKHHISAYNLPPPPPSSPSSSDINNYIKEVVLKENDWSAHIHSVLHDDKIVVTFNASSAADRYTIELINQTHLLKTAVKKGRCNVEECRVDLEYTGPCEDLTIEITPQLEHCLDLSVPVSHKVNCTNRSGLVIGVVYVLALLFLLLCSCIICQILRWLRGSKRGASVRVLLVYPAVDSVFQRAVMSLAQFLQSCGGVTVVIDEWDRGSLAEQGPLRWINTQAELADRVLIISAPQRSQTDDHKSLLSDMTDDTVSASASSLFTLTLNLVSSAAHVPHGRDKFWVVNLQHDEKRVQTELRGCRAFLLPRDKERLHQQLSGGKIQSPALMACFSSFYSRNAPDYMEINPDFPTCAEANSLGEKPHLLP